MDLSKYSTTDFLLNDSFLQYCLQLNEEDIVFWEHYINNHPQQAKTIAEAKELCLLMAIKPSQTQKTAAWHRVEHGIDQLSTKRTKVVYWRWAAAAACLLVLLASSVYFFQANTAQTTASVLQSAKFKVFAQAPADQRIETTLPDGTKAILNPNTIVRINEGYNQQCRLVQMDGEAYFSVYQDAAQPFIVKTGNVATEVLGTAFKIKYQDDDSLTVMLASGKVKVNMMNEVSETLSSTLLTPGEKASVAKHSNTIVKSNIDIQYIQNWVSRKVIFDKADLATIIQTIEENYGVQVNVVNKPKDTVMFTGTFYNEQVDVVLDAISFTNNFKFDHKGHAVIIRF
ncbi:FecR family protein [Chitinophaga skermanii]|uniref:FecR family protein n=1 Tax=Chitinophaga skermanii TaxID=331697 RepID=A0A327R2Q6_9BACT|nr:FecR family protein [Chitinophaga skermanii]RAJ10911.1 FecR family protein [Chitinophaga skermanii]